ncbi:MAG: ATPase [Prevotella sp.]|nr:ATPase [Prevotella sp.]
MKRLIIILASGLIASTSVHAQDEEKLVIKPSGRILVDAGLFDAKQQNDKLNDGVAIPDMRIGAGISYGQWKAKIDMGYSYGKVNMKDVWLQYNFNEKNFLRAGYFIHQYGLQSSTSSSFKESMEEPHSNQAFNNSRMIGVMYQHTGDKLLATASLFTENDAMKMTSDQLGNQGVGAMSRIVYHPLDEPGNIFHIGISGAIESPRYNSDDDLNHHAFTIKTTWPTRIANVTAQQAVVTEAKTMYKFTPEILFSKGRFGIEGQYFLNNIQRKGDLKSFTGSGAYCTLRGLLKGREYSYTKTDGGLATPAPGSMEVVLQYNYTDLSDGDAGIRGGRLNDWSATYNYYINKYMIWRVRASWTKVTDREGYENNEVSILETRLQIKF